MERYEILKDIGSGNFGVAKLVRDKWSGELYAVKYIERGQKVLFYRLHNFITASFWPPSQPLQNMSSTDLGFMVYDSGVKFISDLCLFDLMVIRVLYADRWACSEGDNESQVFEASQYHKI